MDDDTLRYLAYEALIAVAPRRLSRSGLSAHFRNKQVASKAARKAIEMGLLEDRCGMLAIAGSRWGGLK